MIIKKVLMWYLARITGWNAIKSRAIQLDMDMTDEQYKACTAKIKQLADIRPVSISREFTYLDDHRS
jgi:hypothetical protein